MSKIDEIPAWVRQSGYGWRANFNDKNWSYDDNGTVYYMGAKMPSRLEEVELNALCQTQWVLKTAKLRFDQASSRAQAALDEFEKSEDIREKMRNGRRTRVEGNAPDACLQVPK